MSRKPFGRILSEFVAPFLQAAKSILEWINSWSKGTKALATMAGVSTLAFFGLTAAIAGVKTALTLATAAGVKFSFTMALATGGLSLAIGAIVLGIYQATQNWDSFQLNMREGWVRIKEAMRPVALALLNMYNLFAEWVQFMRKIPSVAGVAFRLGGIDPKVKDDRAFDLQWKRETKAEREAIRNDRQTLFEKENEYYKKQAEQKILEKKLKDLAEKGIEEPNVVIPETPSIAKPVKTPSLSSRDPAWRSISAPAGVYLINTQMQTLIELVKEIKGIAMAAFLGGEVNIGEGLHLQTTGVDIPR